MVNLSESQIEELILSYLNFKRRIIAWKVPKAGYFDVKKGFFKKQVSKFARNGVSDISGLLPNKGLFIEVKTPEEYRYLMKHYTAIQSELNPNPKRKHLQEQIKFIEDVKASGNIGFFADSVECVNECLKEFYEKV